jgi:hypothetical protein
MGGLFAEAGVTPRSVAEVTLTESMAALITRTMS